MNVRLNYVASFLLPLALLTTAGCAGSKMAEPELDEEMGAPELHLEEATETREGERSSLDRGDANQDPAPPEVVAEPEPEPEPDDAVVDLSSRLEHMGTMSQGAEQLEDEEAAYDGDLDMAAPIGGEVALLESRNRQRGGNLGARSSSSRDYRAKETGGKAKRKADAPKAQAESKPRPRPAQQPASGPVAATGSTATSTPVAGLIDLGGDEGADGLENDRWNRQDNQPVEPTTEDFTHYGVNDMTLVDDDRFSTFSVDVDTASYSIARRKLNEGWMPPTASVRVEEFVNAMDYDYEAPAWGSNDGAPFAVHMESAPSPWQGNHHVLRVGVQGKEIPAGARKPVHLTFLVDTSGSMNSADKLDLAKQALHELVGNLGEEDTVSLVTYAGDSRVVLEPTSALRQATIHRAVEELSSGGGTHMDSGMNLAYQMASQSYLHGAENRVIVLSDGDANIGRTTHEEILRTVQHHAEEGITLTTVGFGMGNYKDTMMEQLANKGDGNYFYVDSMAEAQKVFGEDLSGTITTIAKDVKIQLEFNPDAVVAYRLIGYENRDIADVDFRNDRVDAGEIGSGHSVTALYDVVLRDDAASQELATVRLRAKKPGPDSAAKEWATVMDGELTHAELASASQDFRIALAAASFAELLRGSPYMVEVSYADVWQLAKSAQRPGELGKDDAELLDLIVKAGELSGERGPIATR